MIRLLFILNLLLWSFNAVAIFVWHWPKVVWFTRWWGALCAAILLAGCTQGECAGLPVVQTNDIPCTNRTLQIGPTPTGWTAGGTVITQWSDGNTNQVAFGNFSWPATNFIVNWQKQPCTNHYGAVFWAIRGTNNPQWSSMATVPFVCDGYEVRGKYLLSTNLCNWKTNNAIAPLIAGYSGSQFFRLSAGATLVFMHDSLPRYFQVVTTNAQAQLAVIAPPPPMPK